MSRTTRVSLRRLGSLTGILVTAWFTVLSGQALAQGGATAPAPDEPPAGARLGLQPDDPAAHIARSEPQRRTVSPASTEVPASSRVARTLSAPAAATVRPVARERVAPKPKRVTRRVKAVSKDSARTSSAPVERDESPSVLATALPPVSTPTRDQTLTALAAIMLAVVAVGGGVVATAAGRLARDAS